MQNTDVIIRHLGFNNVVNIPARGIKGGLCFGWKLGLDVSVLSLEHHVISVLISSDPLHSPWIFSFIHGPTEAHAKPTF